MPNIEDHVVAIGHKTLEERPFDELDALVLTQIVYMPMEGFLDHGERATIQELWIFLSGAYPDSFTDPFQRKRYALTELCATQPRYERWEIHDYVNTIDVQREMQFAVCAFDMPMGQMAIAYRGTDLTLAGWKEDLNMSFMVVPSQQEAVEYLQRVAAQNGHALLLAGHSKGGNLAVYAGANADGDTRDRVQRIYSFDGPGMDEDTLASIGYELVRERIQSYIPQSSVVGMLLHYHPVYTVVYGKSLGILQHDAMTWQVKDGAFIALENLNFTGRLTDEAIHTWLKEMDMDSRRMLVDTLYQVVAASQAETVNGLVHEWHESARRMLEALRELDPEARHDVRKMLGMLFSAGTEAVRWLLPFSLGRKDAPKDAPKDEDAVKEA